MGPVAGRRPEGLFVGLCTLDVVQLVDRVPGPDEKLTARDQVVAAGGPATGAAVAFGRLGGLPRLLTGLGSHPLALGVRADLDALGVRVRDLAAESTHPPAVSSVLVTASTGERAVASTNATGHRLRAPADLEELVACDIAEFDGHHLALAVEAAHVARSAGRLTVLDAGSWKDGTERLLPSTDVAVCSADFHPPGTASPAETMEFLRDHGVVWAAVTGGAAPIVWAGPGGGGLVGVPETRVVDTLGAGDVLHGALAYHLSGPDRIDGPAFAEALSRAATVASHACASFGTRAWLTTG
ncbi:PfkB family carbohydrate kinase [Streptomyces fuscichromogenes]|uniref:Kinase n=1 Tax=Streptomyces fuscichromogenes TaxID=1324013 RepID=A0A917XDW3_9ACTN|nr:PfkB family carbohydrate kinase [Streptomyces fuscichromogenes]GGN13779.1 kinase [Streptomyces fuscichromogenes]